MTDKKDIQAESTEDEVQAQTEAGHPGAESVSQQTAPSGGEVDEGQEAGESASVSELEQARNEAAEMKTRYLRSVADMENYRKRIAREKQEIIRSAAANVIESLLPVLDNLKLGLQSAEGHPEAKDVVIGFQMVESQLKKTLADQGLEELVPDGEIFDPNLHECISHQPSAEVAEDHVIQTVRAGYRLNERLIRAANVIVSSGASKSGEGAEEN